MTTSFRYKECPECTCGQSDILEQERRYPKATKNLTVALRGQTLGNLEQTISSVQNSGELVRVLSTVKEQFSVSVLAWPDQTIQIQQVPGLCKRTRMRLQKAFDGVDKKILGDALEMSATSEEIEG